MDTIKTCMQGDVGQHKYKGIVHTGTALAAESVQTPQNSPSPSPSP